MTRKSHPQGKDRAAPAEVEPRDGDSGEIIERPDGFYWRALDGSEEFGPFESFELARADRDAQDDEPPDYGESLHEAERDIGINEWIDVETGEPAEGESPPHLDED